MGSKPTEATDEAKVEADQWVDGGMGACRVGTAGLVVRGG